MDKRNLSFFFIGLVSALLVLPVMRALGLPGFDVLLVSTFGEHNIWALVLSLLLISLILFGVTKLTRKKALFR